MTPILGKTQRAPAEVIAPRSQSSTPAVAPSSPQASRAVFTRDQLLALGQSRDPYRFIPLATQALAQIPDDAALRFVLATNYARLGLPTLAGEQLDRLPAAAQADPSAQALRAVLAQLPPDRLELAWLTANLHRNLRVISARAEEPPRGLAGVLEAWHSWAESKDWFATRIDTQGRPSASPINIVWRPRPSFASAEPGWTGGRGAGSGEGSAGAQGQHASLAPASDWCPGLFHDLRTAADGVSLDFATQTARPPVTIEGLCPPWLLQRLYAATPEADDGHRVRINVVQAEPLEFLTGLAFANLSCELADPRVHLFVGASSGEDFRTDLHARIDYRVLGPLVQTAGVRVACNPPLAETLQRFQSAQVERQERLKAQVEAIYGRRDTSWYAQRLTRSSNATGEPLRVLVPTCRYSSFVRHSAEDIAAAFRDRGCDARVLIEPDDSTHLAGNAYLAQFAEFKPDLVVLINYPRVTLGGVIPPNVPLVCWVQDPMPHIFDASVGESQTEFDFMVGHTHRELFTRYRYPKERSLGLPVLVNRRKFHPSPVDQSLLKRFSCEVAYASNHGETPESLLRSMLASPGVDGAAAEIVRRLHAELVRAVDRAHLQPLKPELVPLIVSTCRATLGRDPDPILVTRMLNNVALPLADRCMRHQTLHWAADICERRNWRLRIFGKGWESHPRFRAFAQPPLHHGEELRACYQAASVHLHASIHWMFHQRVLECVASGGLVAYRYKMDDFKQHLAFVAETMLREGLPCTRDRSVPNVREFEPTNHPECMKFVALSQRLGVNAPKPPGTRVGYVVQDYVENRHGLPFSPDIAWFLGDPSETCFQTSQELERVIERAVEYPARRESLSARTRERVDRHFTYQSGVERIMQLVTRSLTAV